MNKLFALFSFILLLGWISCQETAEVEKLSEEVAAPLIDSSKIQYLLFLKEGLLEVWTKPDSLSPKKLETMELATPIDFPIGIYQWSHSDRGLISSYPNSFYKNKLGQQAKEDQLLFETWSQQLTSLNKWKDHTKASRLMVLPNDFRKDGAWEACFACPHWMAEVYGRLKVETGTFFD